ncbi:uncharacterized protein LOC142102052 [Mixophyes fleayi]|uniref:uncharacterized protein LOC142102052 n=1 Tax=Mixophyes fleayi TaxID=3061075 RepID=UPI003F4E3416
MGFCKLYLVALTLCVLFQVTEGQSVMIRNVQLEKCIHAAEDTGRVSLAKCKVQSLHQQWTWDRSSNSLINVMSNRCLTVMKTLHLPTLGMEPCEGRRNQAWVCDKRGHLTLYGHELHLTAKQGTKKVFVSNGIDKFSAWKTPLDSAVCGETFTSPTHVQREWEDVTDGLYESKFSSTTESLKSSPRHPHVSDRTTTQIPGQVYTDLDAADQQSASSWERLSERIYVFEEERTGWKTAMLILSPLTFILGVIILMLNVRVNKKRKLLSAMPSAVKPIHKLGSTHEQSPLTGTAAPSEQPGQNPNSPTLRHGEILIEWKDGTITPLYEHQ